MLIAKFEESAKSVAELMKRIRATHVQFVDANLDTYLYPENGPSYARIMVLLAAYAVSALALIGLFVFAKMKMPVVALICLAAALVSGFYVRLHEAEDRRRCQADNRKAKTCLGALVQANDDLFDPDNEEVRWSSMVVALGPELDQDPKRLVQFANDLFAMKVKDLPTPPELEELVSEIRAEIPDVQKRHVIPKKFVGVDGVLAVDVLIPPSFLPHGYVHQRLWPLMFHEGDDGIQFEPVHHEKWWHADYDEMLASVTTWEDED